MHQVLCLLWVFPCHKMVEALRLYHFKHIVNVFSKSNDKRKRTIGSMEHKMPSIKSNVSTAHTQNTIKTFTTDASNCFIALFILSFSLSLSRTYSSSSSRSHSAISIHCDCENRLEMLPFCKICVHEILDHWSQNTPTTIILERFNMPK